MLNSVSFQSRLKFYSGLVMSSHNRRNGNYSGGGGGRMNRGIPRWGHRGRGGGGGYGQSQRHGNNESGSSDHSPSNSADHPPGLHGRQIGMFYAKRAKERKPEEAKNKTSSYPLNVSEEVQSKINNTLAQLSSQPLLSEFDVSNHEFRADYLQNLAGNLAADECLELIEMPEFDQLKDEKLDAQLKKEWNNIVSNSIQYKSLLKFREKLPAYALKKDVTDVILKNQVTVISGETGSGKTTQIPQFILDRYIEDGCGSMCNIICTQPRRISTITVSERVAEERGEIVGEKSVGYSIRLESKLPSRTGGTLTFLVTGVLLQRLRHDPLLQNFTHIIVDEVHERDSLSDFTLVILKDLIKKRPDLKVILMSATLNADKFSEYFPGSVTFHIPGFVFPVEEYYLEDVLEKTHYAFPEGQTRKSKLDPEFEALIVPWVMKQRHLKKYESSVIDQLLNPKSELQDLDLIQATLEYIVQSDDTGGAILVFVTGWDQISTLIKQLETSRQFPSSKFQIYPLHSLMPTASQKEIFKPPPSGMRKIIISTNIAETSITIDDVNFVIDSGRIKMTNFNLELNLETLDSEWVSRANATQRKGRAGRTRPGVCYHLFSRGRERLFDDFKKPEIQRTKLEESILRIKNMKFGNAAVFFRRYPDPPDEKAVELALIRLHKIGALNSDEQLTPLGFHLAKLPMDPYTGKMILMAAIFSCVDPIFSCAASLSFKDCFTIPFGREREVDAIRMEFAGDTRSDHIALIQAIYGFEEAKKRRSESNYCYRNFLSLNTLKQLESVKTQFAEYLYQMKFLPSNDPKNPAVNRNSNNTALIKAIITAGLYPNLAVGRSNYRRRSNYYFTAAKTEEDGRVNFHPKSVNSKPNGNFESPFFVYFLKQKSSSIYLHDSTMISPFPLVFFGGELDFLFDSGYGTLGVDGTTRFECTESVFTMFQDLRAQLDKVLESKITNPGPTHWEESKDEENKREKLLLKAILDLLITEYNCVIGGEDEEEEY